MRWPLQPLQPLQKTQLQSPFGPSVGSLCHPCITTTHLSYSVLFLKLPPPPCVVLLVFRVVETRRSKMESTFGIILYDWERWGSLSDVHCTNRGFDSTPHSRWPLWFQYSDGNPANICAEFPCNFHFFWRNTNLNSNILVTSLQDQKVAMLLATQKAGGCPHSHCQRSSTKTARRQHRSFDWTGAAALGDKGTKNSERDTRWSPFHGWVLNQRSNKSFGLGSFGKIPSP